mmetsp:Transcript_41867/g.40206  ORF Transcript_41867/g.40206 Transcript_41867/m.40206 type:complete len:103 (+) Transcript_41867:398-706(+)|eukprot:CAMPEP_0170556086 /NCGR_PEP_ID=MMETSP0211-20121228/15633_1 /TAXON_ID=311385 /ORGANISM="Pseudokeronopsis sp., Strain OXSARD2" /LENGTH=102 /DNA_ID=CAMNT_0010866221 /DNA_START=401 /DNA_END=709 /DNA_ORIENTATION=+
MNSASNQDVTGVNVVTTDFNTDTADSSNFQITFAIPYSSSDENVPTITNGTMNVIWAFGQWTDSSQQMHSTDPANMGSTSFTVNAVYTVCSMLLLALTTLLA